MGSDLGMLGVKTNGKLRLPPKKEQKTAVKKMKRAIQMSSGATNGLSSSLVFTPVHGIELVGGDTVSQREAKVAEANQKWFSQNSGFLSARPV
jgi:U4/U6 small nuclear ribonucleoprotein PRP31